MRVEDVMTREVEVVERRTGLKDVAHLLSMHEISGVPVVEHGVPVGVVSESDLVAKEQESEAETVRQRRRLLRQPPRADAVVAADVMTAPPVTVTPQTSAVGAAWLMTEHDIDRLLVVQNDRLVGIVTRSDLVRAFGRSDEQIRAEIVGDVLPALGVSANNVSVAVDDGVVLLAGEVEDELEARCLPHAVRSVLGVVEVRSELAARHRKRPPVGVYTY
ncbi:MAG TPA: CBS domain-containing protein [Gaiellaceae bacterium]|nr:CBS domain-containing protein [Gaiellaceae bacterium]